MDDDFYDKVYKLTGFDPFLKHDEEVIREREREREKNDFSRFQLPENNYRNWYRKRYGVDIDCCCKK